MCDSSSALSFNAKYLFVQDDSLYSRCVALKIIYESLRANRTRFLPRKENLSTHGNEEKKPKSNRM
jgi:hypothetical protein